jgi:superfamily II DNA or RNA helicase
MTTSFSKRETEARAIAEQMRLREPQKDALLAFHQVLNALKDPLNRTPQSELTAVCRVLHPSWKILGDDVPLDLTVHLATGVGKTKVIGAIMAYLIRCKDARNFLIVTPRAEIIRKFLRELRPESDKYIFEDRVVIDRVNIISLDTLSRNSRQLPIWDMPNVWVLSPQAFAANNARMKAYSDDGPPPAEQLRHLKDLIVFFDESHHLGNRDDPGVWRKELLALNPRMIIGTTASISAHHHNLLVSYDLKRCLKEGKYTKNVLLIPHPVPSGMNEDSRDRMAISYALQRLDVKEEAIGNFAKLNPAERKVRPILLINCIDTEHANRVYAIVKGMLGDAVQLIHSDINKDDYLKPLGDVDTPESKLRVIVQVAMLNEGWDVSNVYVILPLRPTASVTLVEQVMGRGLRLPYGRRTGDKIVDELEIVCLGVRLEELANSVMQSGYGATIATTPHQDPPQPEKSDEFLMTVCPGKPTTLHIPFVRRLPQSLDVRQASIPAPTSQELVGFVITDPTTRRALGHRQKVLKADFVNLCSSRIVRSCPFIGQTSQLLSVQELVVRLLQECGQTQEQIAIDPELFAKHISDNLTEIYKRMEPKYQVKNEERTVSLNHIQTFVKHGSASAIVHLSKITSKNFSAYRRVPISGWARCLHQAVPFDSEPEYSTARILDSSTEIDWWLRNQGGALTLDTPAGRYSPDFAVMVKTDGITVLLEVKGAHLFGPDSEARLKKKAAKIWCEVVSSATKQRWEHWLLPDSEVNLCSTWSDIVKRADRH